MNRLTITFCFIMTCSIGYSQYSYVEPDIQSAVVPKNKYERHDLFGKLIFDNNIVIDSFIIQFPEEYEGFHLKSYVTKNFTNIEEIIELTINVGEDCISSTTHYYLRSSKRFISLNSLENIYCDGPEPTFKYIFLDDKKGTENTILKAKLTYNEGYQIDSIQILSSLRLIDNKIVETLKYYR